MQDVRGGLYFNQLIYFLFIVNKKIIIVKGYNVKEEYNPSNTLDLQTDVLSNDCQILSNNGN